jgi:RES domain
MPNAVDGPEIKLKDIKWSPCWRIIPSRYPPINFYERIAPIADWDALVEIERLTNPRVLDEVGAFQLIRAEDRRNGPGWGWINAPFTFLNPGGNRFSDGSYGVYYAGKTLETTITETKFHHELFYRATNEGPVLAEMSVIKANLSGKLHDLRPLKSQQPEIYSENPNDYKASQGMAALLRNQDSYGVVYYSVRHQGGECVGLFRPIVLEEAVHDKYLIYEWDGTRISRILYPEQEH